MDGKAAANLSFRLGAWLHLWKGFAKEELWCFRVRGFRPTCDALGPKP